MKLDSFLGGLVTAAFLAWISYGFAVLKSHREKLIDHYADFLANAQLESTRAKRLRSLIDRYANLRKDQSKIDSEKTTWFNRRIEENWDMMQSNMVGLEKFRTLIFIYEHRPKVREKVADLINKLDPIQVSIDLLDEPAYANRLKNFRTSISEFDNLIIDITQDIRSLNGWI